MAKKDITENVVEETPLDEAALRRKAYTEAEKALRENHAEEFRGLVQSRAQALGVEYKFRATKEERAKKQMTALLAEFPDLREQIG